MLTRMQMNPMRPIHCLILLCVASASASASAAGPWRASELNTRGWALMTPRERIEHQATVRAFTSLAECRAYQLRHHAQMQARARENGQTLQSGRDVCEHLLPQGASPRSP